MVEFGIQSQLCADFSSHAGQLQLTPTNPIDKLFVFFAPRITFFSGAAAFLGGIFFFTLAAADVVNVRRKKLLHSPLKVFTSRKDMDRKERRKEQYRRSGRHYTFNNPIIIKADTRTYIHYDYNLHCTLH